jgi:hypothetical protein
MLDNGQSMTRDLTYAPLPTEVAQKVRETVKTVH